MASQNSIYISTFIHSPIFNEIMSMKLNEKLTTILLLPRSTKNMQATSRPFKKLKIKTYLKL